MTVLQLITQLAEIASQGHGNDKVTLALHYDDEYVYQALSLIVPYNDESLIGLVGNIETTDDRREN